MFFVFKKLIRKRQTSKSVLNILILILIPASLIGITFLTFTKTSHAQTEFLSSLGAAAATCTGGISAGAVPVCETNSIINGHDFFDNLKEGSLDKIAWTVAKQMVRQMTQSLITWINSGFQGSPAFIQNPEQFFTDVADSAFGEYLNSTALGVLCSPFQIEIRRALLLNYYRGDQQASCTLSGVLNNIQNFQNYISVTDLSRSNSIGRVTTWEDWWDLGQENNIYEQYSKSSAQASIIIRSRLGTIEKELDWGSGFLSQRDCSDTPNPRPDQSNCKIVTPGETIASAVNNAINWGPQELITADEINEVIDALFGQLLNQIFSLSDGLFGLNQPRVGGGSSYIDQLRQTDFGGSTGGFGNPLLRSSYDLSNPGFDTNITLLQEVISVKNQSIALVNASIALQQAVISCQNQRQLPGAQSVISLANSTINNQLLPIITTFNSNIAQVTQLIASIETFRTRLAALSSDDIGTYQALAFEYVNFLQQNQIDFILPLAVDERNRTLPNTLSPIDSAARTSLTACQNFNPNGGSTGGVNTGGPPSAGGGGGAGAGAPGGTGGAGQGGAGGP